MRDRLNSKRCWGIRAGKGGEAHDLFLSSNVIALADAQMGDLSNLDVSRDSFYDLYRMKHPDDSRTGSAGIAGKFYRFAHEVEVRDLVVYPSIKDKVVYVGEVVGNYTFVKSSPFPHQRKTIWSFSIPKSNFTPTAAYELGAARTFFEFKKNLTELMKMVESGEVACILNPSIGNKRGPE